jgi:hypothetical protein
MTMWSTQHLAEFIGDATRATGTRFFGARLAAFPCICKSHVLNAYISLALHSALSPTSLGPCTIRVAAEASRFEHDGSLRGLESSAALVSANTKI